MRSSQGDSESGDDLIKNQHGFLTVADGPDRFDIARFRRDDTGVAQDRFQNDCGDLSPVQVHCGFQGLKIVPGKYQDILECCRRLTAAAGEGWRDRSLFVRPLPHVNRIEPPMVVSLEADDLPAVGRRAGKSQCRVDRFGS